MSNWFVYDNDGVKKGPVTSAQLKSLANSGKISKDTIIESANGHKGRAGQIKELFSPETHIESSLSKDEKVFNNQNVTDSDITSKKADNQQDKSQNNKEGKDTIERSFLFNSFCERHESALAIVERMFKAYLRGCYLLLFGAIISFLSEQFLLGIALIVCSFSSFVTTIFVHALIRLVFCFMATIVFSNEDILQNQIQLNRYIRKKN